jgi:hypothetical protein
MSDRQVVTGGDLLPPHFDHGAAAAVEPVDDDAMVACRQPDISGILAAAAAPLIHDLLSSDANLDPIVVDCMEAIQTGIESGEPRPLG